MKESCSRWHAISILMANDPKLLDFILNEKRDCLADSAENLKYEAGCFSSGEKILIQIALDIWDDCGGSRLGDVIHTLDSIRFEAFLRALEILRFSQ